MDRIKELEGLITHHRKKYYHDIPEISDYEYDELEEELKATDPNNPLLNSVGSVGGKNKHKYWMPSIQKFKREEEVVDYIRLTLFNHTFSFKLDGSSICLSYEHQQLKSATTRGDGWYGDDKTEYVKYISSIPQKLLVSKDYEMSVFGDILITKDNFTKLQEEMVRRNIEPPKSIRNAVAGLLNRKDNKDLCSYLSFVAHNMFGDVSFYDHNDKLRYIRMVLGMEVPFYNTANYIYFRDFVEVYKRVIDDYHYITDGIVVTRHGEPDLDDKTSHHYRWNCAYKLEDEMAVTKIKDIIWRTGMTGKVTATLKTEPTELSSCVISNVTAHNAGMVRLHNLSVGDTIKIVRSDDFIPKFVGVVNSVGDCYIPRECPSCYGLLEWSSTDTDLFCNNKHCPATIKGRLVNFCKTLEIEGINESVADRIIQSFNIDNPFEIFGLDVGDLLNVRGFGQKTAEKIYNNIQISKNNPRITMAKIIESLGIKNIGRNVSKILDECSIFREGGSIESINNIQGIGGVIKQSIIDNQEYIRGQLELTKLVGFTYPFKYSKDVDKKFTGLSFILSGSFCEKKSEIEKRIVDLGGMIEKSVNKHLNVLITNETGTSKYKKAKELGVRIMTEDEFNGWVVD